MNAGLLCALLVQAVPPALAEPAPAPVVVYALGPWREPASSSTDALQLVDLNYAALDAGGTRHVFGARLLLRQSAYLGFVSEGERRGLSLSTSRAVLRLEAEDGAWRGFASWRRSRWLAELDLHRRAAGDGRGLIASGLAAGRLSPDVELVARFVGDTRPAPQRTELPDRFLRAASLGLLWQRGASFEAFAEAGRARVRTTGGLEFERDEAALDVGGAWRGAELLGALGYARAAGRFPHRQWRADAEARVPLARRLLVEASTRQRFEPGLQSVTRAYSGALGLFGRRVRLARAGEAARREATLARLATQRGFQERRVFGADEILEQRRRLALGAARDAFEEERRALHRAQVEERLVPLLGLEASLSEDALEGLTRRSYGVLLGVPWPPAWPWQSNEACAPFLRLRLSRQRDTYASGLIARGSALDLEVDLSRETLLALRWRRPGLTPLDLVRNTGRADAFEISYSYAFAR